MVLLRGGHPGRARPTTGIPRPHLNDGGATGHWSRFVRPTVSESRHDATWRVRKPDRASTAASRSHTAQHRLPRRPVRSVNGSFAGAPQRHARRTRCECDSPMAVRRNERRAFLRRPLDIDRHELAMPMQLLRRVYVVVEIVSPRARPRDWQRDTRDRAAQPDERRPNAPTAVDVVGRSRCGCD